MPKNITGYRFVTNYVLFYSGGVGRTGVFCAVSILIERVKAEGVIDVFQTVQSLRLQRPAMVQTIVSWVISIF